MKPIGRAGLLRGGIFFLVLLLVPVLGAPGWLLTTLIFTVMYAGLASSWNLIGGYAGYPSLGHVAFFGIGAYAIGILFTSSVGSGFEPFLVLPVVGIVAAEAAPVWGDFTFFVVLLLVLLLRPQGLFGTRLRGAL